ncbi:protein disulfide isomerase-like 1-4 [Zingiber officinale]|uniref:protein disulfide isomerase-like 1-4 n=1 Tax=Zingiber officinale TaxID=94328 RepID=UPI001C4D72CF|nr:protein disulfide isomerase-like 1-4 [Zingiber officinale]
MDEGFDEANHRTHESTLTINKTDVVVLSDGNFSNFLSKFRHVIVEFYAPWYEHCKALASEYTAIAMAPLKEDVVLAKVNARKENELAQCFDVQGFSTMIFLIDNMGLRFASAICVAAASTKRSLYHALFNMRLSDQTQTLMKTNLRWRKRSLLLLDKLLLRVLAIVTDTLRLPASLIFKSFEGSILRASSREMLVFKLSRVLNLLIPFSMISNINLDFSGEYSLLLYSSFRDFPFPDAINR